MGVAGNVAGAVAGLAVIGGVGAGVHAIARTTVDDAAPDDRAEAKAGLVASGVVWGTSGLLAIATPHVLGIAGTGFGSIIAAVGAVALLGGSAVAIAGSHD